VYLDYGAVTIVEKIGKSNNTQTSSAGGAGQKEDESGSKGLQSQGKKGEKEIDYLTQIGAWEIRQFADASHLPGLGIAML
jgi:hypothetical protein